MMNNEQTQRIIQIQEKYLDELMQKAHVVGVGIGYAKENDYDTDELCLVVMVDRKIPRHKLDSADIIPRELEGVRVDVQETGIIEAQS